MNETTPTQPATVAWSLSACLRIHKVTVREIAQFMGITLKRVREVRSLATVPTITAWNFVHEIKRCAAAKSA